MDEGSVHPMGSSDPGDPGDPSADLFADSTGDVDLDAVLDSLEAGMTQAGAFDLSRLVRMDGPSTGLLLAGARFERIRRMAAAFDTAYVTALEHGNEPGRRGCSTTAVFLRHHLRLAPGEAKARVEAAHACTPRHEFAVGVLPADRPVLAAARAAGEISDQHTAVILAALDQLPDRTAPADVAAAEERLVTEAGRFPPGAVARLGQRIADHIDPDGTLRDDAWKQRIRSATLTRNTDGTGTLRARLTPEALETWQAVIDPLARPRPTGPDGADLRTPGQRLHDAIHDAGIRVLNGGDLPACGGTPATVVIHLTRQQYDAELRQRRSTAPSPSGLADGFRAGPGSRSIDTAPPGLVETEHGNLLPTGSAFRLGDQAAVCTVVTDGKGVPLQLGRTTRIASPGQTIALAARDRGCTFPACDRPAAWTQRHHIVPWHLGGATDLTNLALVCGYHHRSFETLGWQCVMTDGRPHWIPPSWIDPRRRPLRNTFFDGRQDLPGP